MIPDFLKTAIQQLKEGSLSESEFAEILRNLPYEDLGFAKVDHHRSLRQGFAEVIFGQSKTDRQIEEIARTILAKSPNLLITRGNRRVYELLHVDYPEAVFHEHSKSISLVRNPRNHGWGKIGVFSAGTADIAVAEEAAVTASVMGNESFTCYDVGVAGLHRLLKQRELLRSCSVVIAVAGMEGALPSVIGGLVDVPVIAVPTSIGYGASFEGLAALLGMLNSCSSNVTVVNIDNGFGAGYVASLINRRRDFE